MSNPDTIPTPTKAQTTDDMLQGNMAGLKAVMGFYEKNKEELRQIENVESYIQMSQKGTLEKFVRKRVKAIVKETQKK